MKKVIFWDFDGTLVKENKRFVWALSRSLSFYGFSVKEEEIEEFLRSVYPWLNYDRSYEGETDKWWDRFLLSLAPFYDKIGASKEQANEISADYKRRIIEENDYVLHEDTVEVLNATIGMGYENYLLSNNYPELTEMMKRLQIFDLFSGFVVSAHVGYEKPRKELFDYAKKLAGVQTAVMVGDNPVADVIGAKNAGFTAVLVHRNQPSEADYSFDTLKPILGILK